MIHKPKCIVVDDCIADAALLQLLITNDSSLELVQVFNNAVEALSLIKEQQPPIIFLDIDMPVLNGMDLFKMIDYSPLCIFVTAHSEFALESYEAHAFDFILKPATEKRFKECAGRLIEYLDLKARADLYMTTFETDCIIIKEGSINYRVSINEIVYIEALKDYSKVVTLQKKYITLSNLKNFIERLPVHGFLRIHKSYAVAKDKIESYSGDEIKIAAMALPIGKTYRRDVRIFLSN